MRNETSILPAGGQRASVGTSDVTERKRSQEARARLAAIVESSDDAIIGEQFTLFLPEP